MARLSSLLLIPLLLAPAASLADAGPARASDVNLYYIPKAEVDSGGASEDGDGFGIRGLIRAGSLAIFIGEYQTVSYDNDADFDQIRVGAGVMSKATGFGGYAEYLTSEHDAGAFGSTDSDGWGLHGRFQRHIADPVEVYVDLGWLNVESETGPVSEDADGLEWTLGIAYEFNRNLGAMLDYRVSNLEGDNGGEVEYSDLRVGLRIEFGY